MANNILQVYKRDTKTYDLTFKDGDGAVIDITGYTVFFTAKINQTDSDTDAVISKTVTSHTDPTAGETQIVLTSSETTIDVRTYYYDIQIKDTSANIITVVKDMFEILQDITTRTS